MNDQPAQEEQIVAVVHKHWASLLFEALVVICPGALIIILLLFSRSSVTEADIAVHALFTLLVPICFLIIWIILAALWTMYYLDTLVITGQHIYYAEQRSLVSHTITEWDIEGARIGVSVSGVWQSLFHFGSLIIEAPGQATGEIPNMPDPERLSAIILKQDDRFGELQDTTKKQEELLKFLSHEVKGHLTKSKAMFASIVEGDFGPVGSPLQSMAQTALADSQKGVDTVMSILDNSNLQKGDLAIQFKPFDLSSATKTMVAEFQQPAADKHLSLVSSVQDNCVVNGDAEKIERHVIRNFIDNALRYTPSGQVDVILEKMNGMARLTVSDTGVGISDGDLPKLFTEGGHGEHSRDVNPESTGYGLFIAKQIVEKHGGRIWARSRGAGMGSQFFAEFPLA